MKHKIEKLPKQAQKHIKDIEFQLQNIQHDIAEMRSLNHFHAEHEWFTIPNKEPESFYLYRLSKDQANPICSLNPGDMMFIGRKMKKEASDD